MKTTSPLLRAFLAFGFIAAHGMAAEKSAPAAKEKPAAVAETPATPAPDASKDAAKKKVVEKGMNSVEITELYGKPKEIKPMESPDPQAKVEQWIYRRKIKETTVQVATGSRMVQTYSGFSGTGNNITEVPEVIYSPKVVIIYQVTALLMVNDKLEIAKQWNEQEEIQQ